MSATVLKYISYAFMAITVIALILFVLKMVKPADRPDPSFVTPPPAKGMPAVPKEEVILKVPLKVYPKKEAAKKLKLPTAIADDPAKQIAATAELKPSVGGYTMAAVIDADTGITELVAKESPRPLFGFGGESEVGLLGGITTRGDSALVFVRQDLLRIGQVHIFAAGGVGVMGSSFGAGGFAGASVRW